MVQKSHYISIVHSLIQFLTVISHFFYLHKYPFPSPSSSFPTDEYEFQFNKKTEAIRGAFTLTPTTASTAYLHLFPCNVPSLLGELSVLLSKAKTSICSLGTIPSHPLKDLTPILFFPSCIIKISFTLDLFHQHIENATIHLILRHKQLDSILSFNYYLISLLAFIGLFLREENCLHSPSSFL